MTSVAGGNIDESIMAKLAIPRLPILEMALVHHRSGIGKI
jgi:hypothetical protein